MPKHKGENMNFSVRENIIHHYLSSKFLLFLFYNNLGFFKRFMALQTTCGSFILKNIT